MMVTLKRICSQAGIFASPYIGMRQPGERQLVLGVESARWKAAARAGSRRRRRGRAAGRGCARCPGCARDGRGARTPRRSSCRRRSPRRRAADDLLAVALSRRGSRQACSGVVAEADRRAADVGEAADVLSRGEARGDLEDGRFAHAVDERGRRGNREDGAADAVAPVVVVGEPPQRGLHAADDQRHVGKELLQPARVDRGRVVRAACPAPPPGVYASSSRGASARPCSGSPSSPCCRWRRRRRGAAGRRRRSPPARSPRPSAAG